MTDYQQSIENSFMMLTGQATLETIILTLNLHFQGDEASENFPIFFIEPYSTPDEDQIDAMIWHFELYEEYEKCAWLNDYKMKL
tara:strand:+ start:8063 stop:8314 length:252 start_codon:yes stop_codon:yes gene_type:complete